MEVGYDSGVGSIDSPGEPASPTHHQTQPAAEIFTPVKSSTPPSSVHHYYHQRPLFPSYVSAAADLDTSSGPAVVGVGVGVGERCRKLGSLEEKPEDSDLEATIRELGGYGGSRHCGHNGNHCYGGGASSRVSGESSRVTGVSSRVSGVSSRVSGVSNHLYGVLSHFSGGAHDGTSNNVCSAPHGSNYVAGSSSSRVYGASSCVFNASGRVSAASSRVPGVPNHVSVPSIYVARVSNSVSGGSSHVPNASSRVYNESSRVSGVSGHFSGRSNCVTNASSCVSGASNHVSGASSRVSGTSNHVSGGPSRVYGASSHVTNASSRVTGASNHIYGASSHVYSGSSRVPRASTRFSSFSNVSPVLGEYRSSLAALHSTMNQLHTSKEAEDPDLDALLADLCQLEEDTKAQLETSQTLLVTPSSGEANRMHTPDLLGEESDSLTELPTTSTTTSTTTTTSGYCHLAIRDPPTAAVSSTDFAQIMQNLQNSRNVVQDPSRSLALSMYSSDETDGGKHSSSSSASRQPEQDLFSLTRRDSQMGGGGGGASGGTGQKATRKSSLRRSSSSREGAGDMTPAHDAVQKQLDAFADQLTVDEALTTDQQMQKLKNEKLRIAMLKLKEASIQKMVLKVHNVDGSTKMIAIHEQMNSRDVCILLAERNHKPIGPNWTLVERLADLHLERTLEDHERVLECLSHWPRGSSNSVVFKNNPEKYYLLKRPQLLMPCTHVYSSVNTTRTAFTEEQKKNIILKELFNNKILPKLEGDLHIRDGKKSGWKKHLFVLRASGLYYSRSGKSLASKDIVRVVEWKDVECFAGSNYKKFYRAPGPHCFSLVPHGPLARNEKRIVHLCVPNRQDLMAWLTGIRLAKHGVQLKQNYEDTKSEMPWLQLEDDNLDLVAKQPEARNADLTSSLDSHSLTVTQQNGVDVGRRMTSPRSSTSISRPESTFSKGSRESLAPSVSASHIISGPVSAGGSRGRRSRPQQSVLANAFEGAWKQGNLTAEMNRESQMWPSFSSAQPKTTPEHHTSPHASVLKETSLPYEEEMSGMFTLKRKKDKAGGGEAGDMSRSSSVSSHSQRSSSSSGSGHRRRSRSTDPAHSNRTSRGSSHQLNHY